LQAQAYAGLKEQTKAGAIDAIEIVAFLDSNTTGPTPSMRKSRLRGWLLALIGGSVNPHVAWLSLGIGIEREIGFKLGAVVVTLKQLPEESTQEGTKRTFAVIGV
jgi:hypothetical protein